MDGLNVEEFINEIEIRPVVWNSKCEIYSSRCEKKNAWEDICEKFIKDFKNKKTSEKILAASSLQKRWRHMRDAYARDLRQRTLKSGSEAKKYRKYMYFDRLHFLSELYEIRPDSQEKNDLTEDGPTKEIICTYSPTASTSKTSKATTERSSTKNDETNTILKLLAERMQNKNNENFEDVDRYFLLSLLNDFKMIPENRKMDAKYDIIGIIRKYASSNSYTGEYYNNSQYHEQRSYNTNQSPGSQTQESNDQFQSTSNEVAEQSPLSNLSRNSDVSINEEVFTDDKPTLQFHFN